MKTKHLVFTLTLIVLLVMHYIAWNEWIEAPKGVGISFFSFFIIMLDFLIMTFVFLFIIGLVIRIILDNWNEKII